MKIKSLTIFITLVLILCACDNPKPTNEYLVETTDFSSIENLTVNYTATITLSPKTNETTTPDKKLLQATVTLSPNKTKTPLPALLKATPTYNPSNWVELPVIPKLSDRMIIVYNDGIKNGNNPRAFSKIGDCGSTPTWFLGDFDRGYRYYNLGQYQDLQKVIDFYTGSFNRTSLAARSGFNASSVLTPLWADRSQCQSNETPLACEYRLHQPVIAFVTMGANDVYHLDKFESQIRQVIEYSLNNGVIPVLSTKPDNVEKTHYINETIARLAIEYQVPLWNYWLAVQTLPNHGLQEDGVHITWSSNRFDKPDALNWGWPVRNLTALQVLQTIMDTLNTDQ